MISSTLWPRLRKYSAIDVAYDAPCSRSNGDEDGYRYNEFDKKADSLRNLEEQKKQKKLDSLDKLQQKIDSAKDKIENSGGNEEPAASPLTMLVPVNDQMVGSDS